MLAHIAFKYSRFSSQLKILLVLWLLSPATRGSSVLYRKFVHPWLTQKEEEIDDCIARAKEQGYSTVLQLGSKGVNYATTVIMQTAIKVCSLVCLDHRYFIYFEFWNFSNKVFWKIKSLKKRIFTLVQVKYSIAASYKHNEIIDHFFREGMFKNDFYSLFVFLYSTLMVL